MKYKFEHKYGRVVLFTDSQLTFLQTVFDFCYQDLRYYNDYKRLKDFKKSIIKQAFEDREYKRALLQYFNNKSSVIDVLSFVTSMLWNNTRKCCLI